MRVKYKNYVGIAQWDEDSKSYHGSVIGLPNDMITFVSNTEKGLAGALKDSVEDYIAFCEETNKLPEKSYTGDVRLRIKPETHASLIRNAKYKGMSLNAYIDSILRKESNTSTKR